MRRLTKLAPFLALVLVLAGCDPGPTDESGVAVAGGRFVLYQCSNNHGIRYAAVNADDGIGRRVWSARKVRGRAAQRIELFATSTPGYRIRGHEPRSLRGYAVGYLDDDRGVNMLGLVIPLSTRAIGEGNVLTEKGNVKTLRDWLGQHPPCASLRDQLG